VGRRIDIEPYDVGELGGKALLPPPHRRPADTDALRHPLCRVSIRRSEHNARPLDVLARLVAVGHDCRQLARAPQR
jgi:hypothetical protein